MTDKIIKLFDATKVGYGQESFMLCPKCMDDTSFLPQVLDGNQGKKFISALLCVGPKCQEENTLVVLNGGYIQTIEQV